ncbi:MAG: putative dsRNA-binding protein, partial [Phenylobacterium sp.]|nr:putative dsRNA-binding protein [Phenylobacterium sp.]
DHAPAFTVEVRVQGYDPEAAQGRSKQEAEKAAALAMLLKHEGPQ